MYYMTFMNKQSELKDGYLIFTTLEEAEDFGKVINKQFAMLYSEENFNISLYPKGQLKISYVYDIINPKKYPKFETIYL